MVVEGLGVVGGMMGRLFKNKAKKFCLKRVFFASNIKGFYLL